MTILLREEVISTSPKWIDYIAEKVLKVFTDGNLCFNLSLKGEQNIKGKPILMIMSLI